MTNKVTVYVPTSKDVVIKGFTNAAYQQRITLDTEGIGRTVLRGSGEKNTPIGTVHFTTPADGGPLPQAARSAPASIAPIELRTIAKFMIDCTRRR